MVKKKIKIIKILSEYKVIINVGVREGIKKGDIFDIIDPEKRILEDPDTGEILDEFDGVKAQVVVTTVKEKYAICETPKKNNFNYSLADATFKSILKNTTLAAYEPDKPKQKALNISEYEIDNIFSKYTDSLVTVGDEVIRVNEN